MAQILLRIDQFIVIFILGSGFFVQVKCLAAAVPRKDTCFLCFLVRVDIRMNALLELEVLAFLTTTL